MPSSSSPKILIVDDETEILSLFEGVLVKADYQVVTAHDGNDAQKKLGAGGIDLIISDLRMPRMDGFELAKWCRENHPSAPFVMISGYASDHDFELAKILGCHTLLVKPILPQQLLEEVRKVLPQAVSYGRVPLEEFMAGKKLASPLFRADADGEMTDLAQAGEEVGKDKIQVWTAAGVSELWLKIEDFEKYVQTCRKVIKIVAESKTMTSEHRAVFVRHALSVVFESLRTGGVTKQSVAAAELAIDECLDLLDTGVAITHLLVEPGSPEQAAYAHPAICAIICAVMAEIMGWSSRKHVLHLALAGFLHDVGVLSLPLPLQVKDPKTFTPEELKTYRSHAAIGAHQLRQAGCPDEIVMASWEHHEDDRGTGYPRRLMRTEIFPMIRLICLVDQFCDVCLRLPPAERKDFDQILMRVVDGNQIDFEKINILALQLALVEPNLASAKQSYLRRG